MKYDALKALLIEQSAQEVPMTFDEIERTIGRPLPASASHYPAWWSNNPSNNVMTKAWLEAGFRTERVDMSGRRLVFRKADAGRPKAPVSTPSTGDDPLAGLYGGLRGTVRLRLDVDLTLPVGEIWDAEQR